ncbi:MAG: hypothetical protein WCP19_02645 [Chloroflexota bacterium]
MNEISPAGLNDKEPLIGIVGVCAAGKSTLIKGLKEHGFKVKHIAQEHSYVKNMWKRITNPDILIFLDASYKVTLRRRQFNWTEKDWQEQQNRLSHARENSNFLIKTDNLSIEEVLIQAINFIIHWKIISD